MEQQIIIDLSQTPHLVRQAFIPHLLIYCMSNSPLMADTLHVEETELFPDDLLTSLHSLETLMDSIKEEVAAIDKERYASSVITDLLYTDDEDVYTKHRLEEEEKYPIVDDENQEDMKEKARKTTQEKSETESNKQYVETRINYERVSVLGRQISTTSSNNVNYPSDKAFHSVILENSGESNAYTSLTKIAASQNLKIEVKEYENWGGGGMYVESINGIKNGNNDYFWEYIVNGKIPDIAADKIQLHSGDLIEWRLLKKGTSPCG